MDRIEQIAKALHEGWWEYQLDRGVQLGPRRASGSHHPHMLPWSALDNEAKNQDRFIASIIMAQYWVDGGDKPITCAMIHDAWRIWENLHGRKHPHDKPYKQAHAAKVQTFRRKVEIDDREHRLQVARIRQTIEKWKKHERAE